MPPAEDPPAAGGKPAAVSVTTADLQPGESVQYFDDEYIFSLSPSYPTITPGSANGQRIKDVAWEPNSVGYLAPNVEMHAAILKPARATFVSVHKDLLRTAAFESIDPSTVEPRWVPNIVDPISADLISTLAKVSQDADMIAWPMISESIASALAVRMLQQLGAKHRTSQVPYPSGLARDKLKLIFDYVQANISRTIHLTELAGVVHLSTFHFARAFRAAMNVTPARYVAMQRIQCAKNALKGKTPLAIIAYACGFSSQSHFSTVFKQATGATPAAFRAAIGWAVLELLDFCELFDPLLAGW